MQHITGSKDKFREWVPEVYEDVFKHFKVDSISLCVHDYNGNPVTFTYQKDYTETDNA